MNYVFNREHALIMYTFKFLSMPRFFSWIVIMLSILIGLFWVDVVRSGISIVGVLVALFSFFLIIIFSYVVITSNMDLIVDDDGIHRRLGGIFMQSISWDNMRRIVYFSDNDPGGGVEARGYNVYPKTRKGGWPTPGGKIVFGEKLEWKEQFRKVLDNYINIHGIRVEGRH